MGMKYYHETHYGILAKEDSDLYNYICDKLRKLYLELEEFEENIELLEEVENSLDEYGFEVVYSIAEDINMWSLSGKPSSCDSEICLILNGMHPEPRFATRPFSTVDECIKYYKSLYGKFLPEDFDYKENINKIDLIVYS